MADWYGRDDNWPRHSESWWRDALLEAKEAGWWLEFHVGNSKHRWGKLRCTRTDDRSVEPCTIRVDCSGKGAENVARDVPMAIRKCPHREGDPTTPAAHMRRAVERLQDAETLLVAVEGVLDERGALEDAERLLLDAFDKAVDDVERFVDTAVSQEAQALDRLQAAQHVLAMLADGSTDAGEGLEAADVRLGEAQQELDTLKPGPAREARAELERLRRRADCIRLRLR